MSRLEKLIEQYGPNSDEESELDKNEVLKLSLIHFNLYITDGDPIQIPNFIYLFIGSAGSAYNLNKLSLNRISHIVCLSNLCKLNFPRNFKYLRIKMSDSMSENLINIAVTVCNFIESINKKQEKILIHCYQGKSRSSAIICAYLIIKFNYTLYEALSLIQTVRPIAMPNQNFMKQLLELEKIYNRQLS